jgi:hypothetical protein
MNLNIYLFEFLLFVSIGMEKVLAISTTGFGPFTISLRCLYGSLNMVARHRTRAMSLHSCKQQPTIWIPCPGLRDTLGSEPFEIHKVRWVIWV